MNQRKSVSILVNEEMSGRLEDLQSLNWYACTTQPRSEKLADLGMEKLNIPHYLPQINQIKKWSDRKKHVISPLFNGYIFVRVNLTFSKEKKRVLQAPKIAYFVQKHSIPIIIPDEIIDSIRIITSDWGESCKVENENLLTKYKIGDQVQIVKGSMAGVRGRLIDRKNMPRIAVFIEAIGQGISFETDISNIEKISNVTIQSN